MLWEGGRIDISKGIRSACCVGRWRVNLSLGIGSDGGWETRNIDGGGGNKDATKKGEIDFRGTGREI